MIAGHSYESLEVPFVSWVAFVGDVAVIVIFPFARSAARKFQCYLNEWAETEAA